MIIAQQFTAGERERQSKSVKRTAKIVDKILLSFSRPLTDQVFTPVDPSSELLDYYHSSAFTRTETTFCVKPLLTVRCMAIQVIIICGLFFSVFPPLLPAFQCRKGV